MDDLNINDDSVSVGFITLSRKIIDHPFFSEKPFSKFHALVWLLLNARYSDGSTTRYIGGHLVTWSRGQLPGSLRYLAEAFGWSTKKVNNWLDILERQQTIKRSVTRYGTVIELTNYEKYQKRKQPEKQGTNEENPLPQGVTEDSIGTKGNAEETQGKHRGNKTEKKDVNKEENKVCVLGEKSHTQDFFKKINEGNYNDEEKECLSILHGYICKYAPVLLKFQEPLTPSEGLWLVKKYTEEIAVHIFMAIENKVDIEKKYKSAAETIRIYLNNESNPKIKALIKNCHEREKKMHNPVPKQSHHETREEIDQRLLNEVINTPHIPPVKKIVADST